MRLWKNLRLRWWRRWGRGRKPGWRQVAGHLRENLEGRHACTTKLLNVGQGHAGPKQSIYIVGYFLLSHP